MEYYSSNEIRNIVLRSYDINPSNTASVYWSATGAAVATTAGTVADNRNTMIWNNVNLRQMMGDTFYNKFDKFDIRINSFFQGQTATSFNNPQTAATVGARSVDIYMSGLPFNPSPYNQGSSSKSAGRVQITSAILPALPTNSANAGEVAGSVSNYGYSQSSSYPFSKTADNPTIKIEIVIASTQTAYIPLTDLLIYGHTEFNFEIHGLTKKQTNFTNLFL